jgi:hypothetical protein
MAAVHSMQVTPLQVLRKIAVWLLSSGVLIVLYFVLFAAGAGIVAPYLPVAAPEPGPFPQMTALLIVCLCNVLVLLATIHSSRWHGWKLVLGMSFAWYIVVTLVTQLEAWYFLLGVTVSPQLMSRLFLQGIPIAFIFIPIAVLVMGRLRPESGRLDPPVAAPMNVSAWVWRLGVICIAYLVLYFTAGYFIAWQNPDVRAFYGAPGEALSFFQQMTLNVTGDPWLTPYQVLRALLWTAGAYPVIRGSRLSRWQRALVVGLLMSVPQNIGHILSNPLLPIASVRMSHLIETASSTLVFGGLVTWLLYPRYISPVRDPGRNPTIA